MTNKEKLTNALVDFQKKYPGITSGDLQTFIIGWQEAINAQQNEPIVRHSCEMITEEYVYKNDFRFQRTQKHGIWFVTYQNHLITFGQYRHDLENWINANYI